MNETNCPRCGAPCSNRTIDASDADTVRTIRLTVCTSLDCGWYDHTEETKSRQVSLFETRTS